MFSGLLRVDRQLLTCSTDISFQNALAKSAVSAAEDVRSAVRISRTAANAKAAALAAAFAAQNACDTMTFSSIDEARAAQTRSSIANSHAIHAAVVDHEAKTVMRRSTLALAHDVKVWNVHRKREMLKASIDYARSQHEATRRAVDAWSSLRDGFIGTTVIPSAQERRQVQISPPRRTTASPSQSRVEESTHPTPLEASDVIATIFAGNDRQTSSGSTSSGFAPIVPVDHHVLSNTEVFHDTTEEPTKDMIDVGHSSSSSLPRDLLILPFATAAPIPEEDEEEEAANGGGTSSSGGHKGSWTGASRSLDDDPDPSCTSAADDGGLSASMQSLIDGLMMWGGGGGLDVEEDHFALPAGMAASIALGGRSRSSSDASPKVS